MGRRQVVVAGFVTLGLFTAAVSLAGAAGAGSPSGCRRGNPMANVRDPSRLKVVSPCQTASGVVVETRREGDGDVDVFIRPDPSSAHLLNAGNRARGGVLWLEIVPADGPRCVTGKGVPYGVCTGAHLATPKVGSHVSATGPYVLDTAHNHMEIHPAWNITGN